MTRILLVALVCLSPTLARADGCYQQSFSRSYAVKSYVAPVYQQSFIAYYVGAPIRVEAMVQAELKTNPDYQEFKSYQEFKGEFESFLKWKQSQSAVPSGALPSQQSLLASRCNRCHSGENPKGGRDFSGSLTADDLKAIKEILPKGSMPPQNSPEAKDFTNELAGSLILEAIDRLSTDTGVQP